MNGSSERRVLSGMRPTGRLHLGHYHGVLKNWVRLQHEYECFFFVADWHALTTHYEDARIIEQSVWEMIVDWLAAGVDPQHCSMFIQSRMPQHAELHVLLSMITPLGWLEQVPTYKDQQEKLKERDLATYGFLGYPLLQSADILLYRAGCVPVGADQVAHVELTREIARRFNHLFGRELGFAEAVVAAMKGMGKKNGNLYAELRKRYQEQGDQEALSTAQALVRDHSNMTIGDKERLLGALKGSGKIILPEPQAMLTPEERMPGLDGQKMSKSYGNTITLRDTPDEVVKKIRLMPTDPARVRLIDPGNPSLCPVWKFHEIYSDDRTKQWVQGGCRSAGMGCLDCKKPIMDAIIAELEPIRSRAAYYESNPDLLHTVINEGCGRARELAEDTLDEVRSAMGLNYR